ncbi:MAG: hypothetical protein IKQ97_10375 [Eubacterium sp.]|nr:hypothetical protein [Eubacterium sp.]
MKDRNDEFKKLEEEMVEKGSAVNPVERPDDFSTEMIEEALERTMEKPEPEDEPHFVSPEEEEVYRKKKKRIILIVVLVTLLLALGVGAYLVLRMLGPSTEKADLNKVFAVSEDEVALIVDGTISEEKGRVIDGQTYLPADIVGAYVDNRVYVDDVEKILSYTTEEGTTDYGVGEEKDGEKPLLEADGALYVSFSFAVKNASCEYSEYSNPNRIAIFYDRTKSYTVITLDGDTDVRTGPGKKYPYLVEAKAGEELFVDTNVKSENDYQPVVTKDGIAGYIPMDSIRNTDSRTLTFNHEPTSFTQKALDGNVCMGWHNIGSENYSSLPLNIDYAKPLNVLAPTWLVLKDNKGKLSSITDAQYVKAAHAKGLQIWPTVRDFPGDKLKLKTLLGQTTTRRKLIENILKEANKYAFDGINVDFERVKAEAASAYLQFLRELTVEAHAQNLIISSDNYPIREYNAYYNAAEQGRIVDYCIFMAYDEHFAGSEEAGSVSSLLYVQDAIAKAIGRMPKERVVIGLPFFTRLWLEKKTANGVEITSEVLGMGDAENWIWNKGTGKSWDKEVGQNYTELKVGKKKTYRMWVEDEKSIKNKLSEAKKNGIAGVAFWSMGSERSITWDTITKVLG